MNPNYKQAFLICPQCKGETVLRKEETDKHLASSECLGCKVLFVTYAWFIEIRKGFNKIEESTYPNELYWLYDPINAQYASCTFYYHSDEIEMPDNTPLNISFDRMKSLMAFL